MSNKTQWRKELLTGANNLMRIVDSMKGMTELHGNTNGCIQEAGLEGLWKQYERLGHDLYMDILPKAREFLNDSDAKHQNGAKQRMRHAIVKSGVYRPQTMGIYDTVLEIETGRISKSDEDLSNTSLCSEICARASALLGLINEQDSVKEYEWKVK